MNKINKLLLLFVLPIMLLLAWCTDADVISRNLSKDADNFKIYRRVIFYNWITSEYMLSIEWFCSLGNTDPNWQLSVTCKTDNKQYKKHFLGLSDNVTYFVEQLNSANVSAKNYKVIFKPSVIIPDIELR